MILADAYRTMATIRLFEERCVSLKEQGQIQGSLHLCCGQEAIPVGACSALEPDDALVTTYRGHGWAVARGVPVVDLFAELMGRDSGLCGGRAGSALLSSADHGLLGENSIVGAGLPIAVGAALAAQLRGEQSVSVVSIGDGAMNQGAAHEALNFAGIRRLPLVVVLENNLYSELTPTQAMIATESLVERAPVYGLAGVVVDGNDPEAVEAAVRTAVERAHAGNGGTLIEAMTERIAGHYDLDPQHYRPKGEIDAAREREPLVRAREQLEPVLVAEIDRDVVELIAESVEAASAVPLPDAAGAREHLYA